MGKDIDKCYIFFKTNIFTIILIFNELQERRPYLATECDDLPQAEKWRRQIIGEISRKVAQIQNGEC